MTAPTALAPVRRQLLTGLRRVAGAAATPLLPSDYLDLFDPLRSADLRARIEAVHPETRDAVTLVLRPGRGWQGHVPGQYVRLGVDVDGVRQWRAYSLTCPPRGDGRLTVTVKAIADGVVSNHLVRRARPGTVVQLDQAAGDFGLPAQLPAKVLFVTGGSGITPVMGMLRTHLPEFRDVVLVHSAPTASDVLFAAELRAVAGAGRLRLVEQHSGVTGMLTGAQLSALVPDVADRETWACGPVGMLEMLEKHWADLGVPDRLHTERFRPAVVVTGDGGTVTFERTGRAAEGDGATPLLEVGQRAGVLMPFGCLMGVCYGCVLPLREGAVRDLRDGSLTTATAGNGVLVQTCISAAAGPCHLDV